MEARVKSTWPLRALQALAGQEFIKDEFRPVAPGFEAEAKRHPYLEVRDTLTEDESVPDAPPTEGNTVSAETPRTPRSRTALRPHTTISKGKGGKK